MGHPAALLMESPWNSDDPPTRLRSIIAFVLSSRNAHDVALPLLSRHVDRAAHANDTTALEYVQAVLEALERSLDNAYWGFFLLMAWGNDLVSYLEKQKLITVTDACACWTWINKFSRFSSTASIYHVLVAIEQTGMGDKLLQQPVPDPFSALRGQKTSVERPGLDSYEATAARQIEEHDNEVVLQHSVGVATGTAEVVGSGLPRRLPLTQRGLSQQQYAAPEFHLATKPARKPMCLQYPPGYPWLPEPHHMAVAISAVAEDATCPTSLPQKQGTKNDEPAPGMIRAEPGMVRDEPRMIRDKEPAPEPQATESDGKPSPLLRRSGKAEMGAGKQGVGLGLGSPRAPWNIKATAPPPPAPATTPATVPATVSRLAGRYPVTPGIGAAAAAPKQEAALDDHNTRLAWGQKPEESIAMTLPQQQLRGRRHCSWLPTCCSPAAIATAAVLLCMALLLLFGHSFSPSMYAAQTQTVTSALAPSHLPMGDGQLRLQSGLASPTEEAVPQPWMEQAAAALPSTADDRLTAAALPTHAACADPTSTSTSAQAHTSAAMSPISSASEDQGAMATNAATAFVLSSEEEAATSAGTGWASSSQAETVGSCTTEHSITFLNTVASLFPEPSWASCPAQSSAADSAQDAAATYGAPPATAAETGGLADPTSTEHPGVVPQEARLVCTVSPRPMTSLEDVVLRELAAHSLMCPATAVAASDAAAEAATIECAQASAEHSEEADPAVPTPAQPFHASNVLMPAAAAPFAAAAAANEMTDATSGPFPSSDDAACAEHTMQQCSSAAAAALYPGVAVDEPFSYASTEENQLVVANIISQTTNDQALALSPETARLPSDEVINTDSGRPNSPPGAPSQPDAGGTAALAAEVQPMLQQDTTQDSIETNSHVYMHMQLQTAPYTDRVAHSQPPSCAATHKDLSTLDAHAAPDVTMAADVAAVSAVPSQPGAGAPMFAQSLGIAELHHSINSLADSAEAADAPNVDASTVLFASAPEAADLEADEDPHAALAAELAAMMAHAAVPSAPIARVSEPGTFEQCADEVDAAISCTDTPASTLLEPTEMTPTAEFTMSVPAGNVGPGAASMWAAALAEQELAHSQQQNGPHSDCEEPLATAAAIPDQPLVTHLIEVSLDATTWHALLVEASWLHANQLQRTPAHTGKTAAGTATSYSPHYDIVRGAQDHSSYDCLLMAWQSQRYMHTVPVQSSSRLSSAAAPDHMHSTSLAVWHAPVTALLFVPDLDASQPVFKTTPSISQTSLMLHHLQIGSIAARGHVSTALAVYSPTVEHPVWLLTTPMELYSVWGGSSDSDMDMSLLIQEASSTQIQPLLHTRRWQVGFVTYAAIAIWEPEHEIVVDGGKGLMTSRHFDPWPVTMYSKATAVHVYPHMPIAVSESDEDEQLQEQLQELQEQLAKQRSQAARAEAKAEHYRRLYKQVISTAR